MKSIVAFFVLGSVLLIGAGSCKKDKVLAGCTTTDTISFSKQIKPMIDHYCISCHGSGGTSPDLTSHAKVSSNAGLVVNSLNGSGAKLMPLGGPALNDSLISQFSCWISQGKQNN